MKLKMPSEIKAYLPVFINLLISLVFVYIVYSARFFVQATVFTEKGGGTAAASAGILNALIMLLFALAGGFGIFYIIKSRNMKALMYIFTGAFFFIISFMSYYMLTSLIEILARPWSNYYWDVSTMVQSSALVFIYTQQYDFLFKLILLASLVNGAVVTYSIFKERSIVESNTSLIFMSSMTGAFLAILLPSYTSLFLLIGLSIYDIYAVFKGPIKHITEMTDADYSARTGTEKLPDDNPVQDAKSEPIPEQQYTSDAESTVPVISEAVMHEMSEDDIMQMYYEEELTPDSVIDRLVYKTAFWDLGLGDLVFYSMLTAMAFMFGASHFTAWGALAPWIPFILAAVGVMAGLKMTITLLERNYILPALPLSVLFGLIGLAVAWILYYIT